MPMENLGLFEGYFSRISTKLLKKFINLPEKILSIVSAFCGVNPTKNYHRLMSYIIAEQIVHFLNYFQYVRVKFGKQFETFQFLKIFRRKKTFRQTLTPKCKITILQWDSLKKVIETLGS